MKKYILILGLTILLGSSVDIFGQGFMPDNLFTSDNDSARWFQDGTAFCSFNGATYAFTWEREKEKNPTGMSRWYTYVYIIRNEELQPFIVNNSSKLVFGYKHESDYGYGGVYRNDVTIIGNTFAFSYYGHLWYSCVIKFPPYPFYNPGAYYQLWARYDPDSVLWKTWMVKTYDEPVKFNTAGYQVDSLLHLFYYDGTKGSDGDPIGLGKDIYRFDPATSNIVLKEHANLFLLGTRIGGMFAYKDTCGNTNYVYNSYQRGNTEYVTAVGPVLGYQQCMSQSAIGASVMVQGSAQGKRPGETVQPEKGNRFNVFATGNVKKADGSYPLYDLEFVILDNCAYKPYAVRSNEVSLPSTCEPYAVEGHYQIDLTTAMIPKDFSKEIDSTDGILKQIRVFYPDDSKYVRGAFFNSDSWRPVPNASKYNFDLDKDELYGPEIRKLWTMVGITDGAPPCSINWPLWETWYHTVEPTELAYSIENVNTTEVTTTYEDAYSVGTKIDMGAEKMMGLSLEFEYANSFKSLVSSSHTVSTKISTNFGLNESAQEYGYYLWNVPQIIRTSYMVYPWYDTLCLNPVTSSLQYQFRTVGSVIMPELIESSKFPFQINEPNDTALHDFTSEARQQMFNSALTHGLSPLKTLNWTSPLIGQFFTFKDVNRTTSSVETKNSFTWGEGSYFACPGIFKVSANLEMEVNFSTEYVYESEFGNEVEVSLENLKDDNYGVNFSKYNVSVYWFKPNVAHWWYLDSMGGQKPWYIGYIVSSLSQKILLLSPEPGSLLRSPGNLFTWQTEDGELADYELFISADPTAGPGSTVYRLSCGNKTVANPEDFVPEPGKTYYWSVRGVAPNGEAIWSDSRAFSLGDDHSGNPDNQLKASIYPNPVNNGQIFVSYDLPEAGKVSVCIYDINGHLLQKNDQKYAPAGITTELLKLNDYAPGIYIVVILTEKTSVTRKMIIK